MPYTVDFNTVSTGRWLAWSTRNRRTGGLTAALSGML
jgi:hypothetical protein